METIKRNTLSKNERLFHNKRIDRLFKEGQSFIAYPLRIVYVSYQSDDANISNVCMMVSVSKKKFKRAVKRNRIKRLVRESFRLNKECFQKISNENNTKIDIAFLYLKNELCDFEEIDKAICKSVLLLDNKLSKKENAENNI